VTWLELGERELADRRHKVLAHMHGVRRVGSGRYAWLNTVSQPALQELPDGLALVG
jgi:hypothetical protein